MMMMMNNGDGNDGDDDDDDDDDADAANADDDDAGGGGGGGTVLPSVHLVRRHPIPPLHNLISHPLLLVPSLPLRVHLTLSCVHLICQLFPRELTSTFCFL